MTKNFEKVATTTKNVHPKSKSERKAFAPKTQLKLNTIPSLSNIEVFTSNGATHKHLNYEENKNTKVSLLVWGGNTNAKPSNLA